MWESAAVAAAVVAVVVREHQAEAEGKLAGMAAALSLNLSLMAGQDRERRAATVALRRHRRFQAGLWRLFAAPRPTIELAEPRTFICRCEELSKAGIDESFAEGQRGIGAINGIGARFARRIVQIVGRNEAEQFTQQCKTFRVVLGQVHENFRHAGL